MNDGINNEKNLLEYINNRSFNEYNENIRDFLDFIFEGNIDYDMQFICKKQQSQVKPDLSIEHAGITKYISVKKGTGNSVHQEKISCFFPYIESLLGEDRLIDLKIFHYGDGTLDDTGDVRYEVNECKKRYKKEICRLNNDLNESENLSKFLDRFLFIGNVGTLSVDVIYIGTIEKGLWATKSEIINYIENNNFDSNAIHFGPLTYQVWGRDAKRTALHPDRRYVMQVKWGRLSKHLQAIRGL